MSETKRYRVTLHGCDDSTPMEVDLTEEEAALVRRLCEQSEAVARYSCMPIMEIEPATPTVEVPHA